MKNIYYAKQIVKNDRVVVLDQMSWIFNCPDCEYVMTALTEEGAETIRHTHIMSMPSTHLETFKDDLWDESPLSKLAI